MMRANRFVALLAVLVCAQTVRAEDTPPPEPTLEDIRQVQIQAWISETNEQGLRDLGANLSYTRFVRGQERAGSVERVRTMVFDPLNPDFTVTLPAPDTNPPPDNLRPDLDGNLANGIQTQGGAGMSFSIIDAGRGTIDGMFRAIERKSDVDLISKPELLVLDGQTAKIHAGGQVPFQDVGYQKGRAQLNVKWENIGVIMELIPTIDSDDMVKINFTKLEVSDLLRIEKLRNIDLPVFSTRSQSGMVLVPNGQTLVIGGLSSRLVRKTEQRVPIVGKMPLLGIPFRGRKSEAFITHLLIFVSPTVVDLRDMKPNATSALNFWREGRWQHIGRIDIEIQAMENEL